MQGGQLLFHLHHQIGDGHRMLPIVGYLVLNGRFHHLKTLKGSRGPNESIDTT